MNINNINDNINNWLTNLFVSVCIIAAIGGCIYSCTRKSSETTSPVEERHEIDSLIQVNDKLIIEVKTLDSIKNVETIEVKALDNDSTLKLFYKLIGK